MRIRAGGVLRKIGGKSARRPPCVNPVEIKAANNILYIQEEEVLRLHGALQFLEESEIYVYGCM